MTDATIQCPNCKSEFKLTDQLAAPIVEAAKARYRDHLNSERAKIAEREAKVKTELLQLARDREAVDQLVEGRLEQERSRIAEDEARKARTKLDHELKARSSEIATLNETLKERDLKLAEANQAQAELLREKRALADAQAALELTVEKRVQDGLATVKQAAKREVEEALQLTVRDRDRQIDGMRRQIEDLKRKAEQGSQQHQGEVLELELEDALRQAFPTDLFEPVGKGENGGDVLQRVVNSRGVVVGTILWEIKRTKNWSDSWLPKLRTDQRNANADLAIIVSQALPKETHTFEFRDDVWVASQRCAVPVATALRESLLAVFLSRKASENQLSKQGQLYQYLTGPRFKHRVRAVLEKYSELKADLEQERRVISKQWAKREQQLHCIADSLAGMSGDLQGIAGQDMMEVEGLDLSLLPGRDDHGTAAAA